jgi:hypothetical protein
MRRETEWPTAVIALCATHQSYWRQRFGQPPHKGPAALLMGSLAIARGEVAAVDDRERDPVTAPSVGGYVTTRHAR